MGSQMDRQAPEIRHLSKTDPVVKRLIHDIGTPTARRRGYVGRRLNRWHERLRINNCMRKRRRVFCAGSWPCFRQDGSLNQTMCSRWTRSAIRGAGFSQARLRPSRSGCQDARWYGADRRHRSESSTTRRPPSGSLRSVGLAVDGRNAALIFNRARPDVLPIDDFQVCATGFASLWSALRCRRGARFGERWKPYRTAAAVVSLAGADPARRKPEGFRRQRIKVAQWPMRKDDSTPMSPELFCRCDLHQLRYLPAIGTDEFRGSQVMFSAVPTTDR